MPTGLTAVLWEASAAGRVAEPPCLAPVCPCLAPVSTRGLAKDAWHCAAFSFRAIPHELHATSGATPATLDATTAHAMGLVTRQHSSQRVYHTARWRRRASPSATPRYRRFACPFPPRMH